ncbi:Putative 8-oxo-dGTP diphosphatase YtkD [Lysinibacillus sphaericus]
MNQMCWQQLRIVAESSRPPPKHQRLCTIHKRRGVEVPGGKVEPGETLEQAAVREVFEETGVHVKNLQWFARICCPR